MSPAGTYARNILNRLLIDLSWNSSRLEGNTYSLLETKRLIELGENAVGKDASEAQMEAKNLPETDTAEIFKLIEMEIIGLHDGNIARFKIRPSEFQEWKILQ